MELKGQDLSTNLLTRPLTLPTQHLEGIDWVSGKDTVCPDSLTRQSWPFLGKEVLPDKSIKAQALRNFHILLGGQLDFERHFKFAGQHFPSLDNVGGPRPCSV